MKLKTSGTAKRLDARRSLGGDGAVDAGAGAFGVACWLRVLRHEACGEPAAAGPGEGVEKESTKAAEVRWSKWKQPAADSAQARAQAAWSLCASGGVSEAATQSAELGEDEGDRSVVGKTEVLLSGGKAGEFTGKEAQVGHYPAWDAGCGGSESSPRKKRQRGVDGGPCVEKRASSVRSGTRDTV
eukprot:5153874-Pleurochrysis_carterae.AAC.2